MYSYIVTYLGFPGKLNNEFVLIHWILTKFGILIVPINVIIYTEVYSHVFYKMFEIIVCA